MMLQLGLQCLLLQCLAPIYICAAFRLSLSVAKSESQVPEYKDCGGNINDVPEGIIDFPGDGKWYQSNKRCTWQISVNTGDRIAVSFDYFHLRNCDDTLLIKNGQNGAKIGQYCGRKKTIPAFETKANELYLYFHSNGALNYKGFKLSWKVISNNESSSEMNQCISSNDEPSILWNKVNATGTAILSAVNEAINEANNNITSAMEMKIQNLQMELQAMKDDQDKVLNNMTEVNSKLDFIIEHLGSCQKPQPTTKSPISTTTTTTTKTPETPVGPRGCTCGIPNAPKRIIGGQAVVPNKYPWHVGLYSSSEAYDYFCGGTIINTLYVLIAAHCLWPTYPSDLVVGVGDHNQTDTLSGFPGRHPGLTEHIPVLKVWVHYLYDENTLANDIAVVKLTKSIEFTDGFGIRPICLPNDATNTYENELGIILGWGTTNYTDAWGGFDSPHVLQEAQVRVLAPNCNGVYENLTSTMICAASPGKDACTGDSGGSLAVSSLGQYTQVGITSWGYGCADEYYPGVYSRITSFLPFIYDLISDGEFCPGSEPPNPSPIQDTLDCKCGVPNYPKRIIMGDPVDAHKYPWHVGLYQESSSFKYNCGGTIINSLFVLTAAHCVYPHIPEDLMVGIGDHIRNSVSDDTAITQYVRVAKTFRHNKYDDDSTDYDFALLKLSKHIQFNDEYGIRPVCLPNDESKYVNEWAKILGWGRTNNNNEDSLANILQEADVVIYNERCNNTYPRKDITAQMMCAAKPGIDSCNGDSGGSLTVFEAGQYYQVGITSWGYNCADRDYPGVYSRVTAELDWITDIAKEGQYCKVG